MGSERRIKAMVHPTITISVIKNSMFYFEIIFIFLLSRTMRISRANGAQKMITKIVIDVDIMRPSILAGCMIV